MIEDTNVVGTEATTGDEDLHMGRDDLMTNVGDLCSIDQEVEHQEYQSRT